MKPTHELTVGWVIVLGITLTSCASLSGKNRTLAGVSLGGALGAGGGIALSPNDESRAINAIVFGLLGGIMGGGAAIFSDPNGANQSGKSTALKEKELGRHAQESKSFELNVTEPLPEFVKERFRPVVIEEFVEADRVSEEGTLHEPHKAYRIKRPAELIARPVPTPSDLPVGGGK
jgi:hypothetical protein